MAYYQLPHEVGQRRVVVASGANAGTVLQEAGDFPFAQELAAASIPVVLPQFDGNVPVSLYKEKQTEIRTDLLGNPRAENSLSLFNYTDDYALREDVYVTEIQGLNETGEDDLESAKWAQLENVIVSYSPLPTGYIEHDPDRRAVRLELAKANGGFQRARISTRKRFRYQTGRVMRASVCLQMSLADLPACEKLWGIGDSLDGFFFQIIADGSGDNFRVIHRRSSGDGLVKDVVVPRSQFNGDKLDGSGNSNASIDFTKNCMYLVEWGWYGASSARFYAFVVDEATDLPVTVSSIPRGRWVLMHELLIPDSLDAPSLGMPALPFTIEIVNNGYLVEPQFAIKYGLSLQVDGGETEKADMHAADLADGRDIGPLLGGTENAHYFPLAAIRAKAYAPGQLLNILQGLPKSMDVLANYRTEVAIFRDPTFGDMEEEVGHVNGELPFDNKGGYGVAESLLQGYLADGTLIQLMTELPDSVPISVEDAYTLTDMGTLEGNFVIRTTVDGKRLASFYVPGNKPKTIDLTSIYDLVRESITAEYDSKFDFPVVNEKYEITNISGAGVLTLDRKHSLETDFRIVIGGTTFYVLDAPGDSTIRLTATRGSAVLYNNYSSAGIVAGTYLTGFYDLIIDEAIATRAAPIDQGAIVIAARRVEDRLLPYSADLKDAEWMRTFNCTTSNTYNVVSPTPEVRLFFNYGLR